MIDLNADANTPILTTTTPSSVVVGATPVAPTSGSVKDEPKPFPWTLTTIGVITVIGFSIILKWAD